MMNDFSAKALHGCQQASPNMAYGPAPWDETGWDAAGEPDDATVLLDDKWQITHANQRARELLHFTTPAVVGRDFWDMLPDAVTHTHQGAVLEALAASDQHSLTVHQKFEGSWTQYMFMRLSAGYMVRLRDVAATQRLQQRFEASARFNELMFAANPNVMWLFDATSLQILDMNQAAVEFYMLERGEFLQLRVGALFPDGEGASLLSELPLDTSQTGALLASVICKQRKANGQLVLVELVCRSIVWHGHHGIFVNMTDVSFRNLAERALRQENANLQLDLARAKRGLSSANRDLAAFTYALSHDLHSPLHAVNGFATLLMNHYSGVLDKVAKHYVQRIQAGSSQLAKLVDDLKTLVQLPALASPLEDVDVQAACTQVVDALRKRDPDRAVTVEFQVGHAVRADKSLLTAALGCLLANAWKFTSKRADGWILVALLPGKTAREVVLQISDNGAGFDVAYAAKLFTPFQRLHSSADFAGNGLGLAIVKRVAEKHGGLAWAESTTTGASFYVSLPGAKTETVNPVSA